LLDRKVPRGMKDRCHERQDGCGQHVQVERRRSPPP
jgi:hypothetical protein